MTWIITGITIVVSLIAFSNYRFLSKMQFNAYQVYHRKEWYRMFSHGLVHVDWWHLLVNMFVLISFGQFVESAFNQLFDHGSLLFILMYIAALPISSLTTLKKQKDNPLYNAVGASGAVSAILFASILLNPTGMLLVYFIPMPGIVFGVLYLVYSQYMSRRNKDNINHDAHFLGAVFGFTFPLLLEPRLLVNFISSFNIF